MPEFIFKFNRIPQQLGFFFISEWLLSTSERPEIYHTVKNTMFFPSIEKLSYRVL